MNEFLLLFHGGGVDAKSSPEEMQENLAKWGVWMKKINEMGVHRSGNPLAREGNLLSRKGDLQVDFISAESKELIGGYVIIEVENLEKATEYASECPVLEYGGKVQVRQITPVML